MLQKLHRFKSALAVWALTLTASVATAADYTGSTPLSGKSYYFYNVATEKFLTAGDNWGTHASLAATGTDLRLSAVDDAFSIRTHYGSNYLNRATDGVWLDQATVCAWYFTPVEGTDYYTISTSTANTYLQYSGTGTKVIAAGMPAKAANAYWQLVTVEQLTTYLKNNASSGNPIDATFMMPNADFGINYSETSAWSGDAFGGISGARQNTAGSASNWIAYTYDKAFDTYTDLTVQAGIYTLEAQGFNRNPKDEQSIDAQLYAGKAYTILPDIHTGSTVPTSIGTAAQAIANGEFAIKPQTVIATTTTLRLGLRKSTNNTGDWTTLDNIRLAYRGNDTTSYIAVLTEFQAEADALEGLRYGAAEATALADRVASIATVRRTSRASLALLASNLSGALSDARYSVLVFGKLQQAITNANAVAATATGDGADALRAAIASAQAVYDAPATTNAEATAATKAVSNAVIVYQYAYSNGIPPTVVTDTRYARGGTMAFGRIASVTSEDGSAIKECGFVYATHPGATYADDYTTEYISNNGNIYWIKNLTPGTLYYMRAYAITEAGAIGYGDEIKFATVPKANVQFSMRDGGDTETYNRIKNAAQAAADLWNDLTSITGYNSSIGYASGTPTADCSYGGWMRVGPNASYQRTGTILHEWLHGIGVGTTGLWNNNADLRANTSTGLWLGERANAALRFWDNNNSANLTGDATHMWPYGINGAHEDNGSNALYIGLTLITQGLGEDGLVFTNSMGFAAPAYTFVQDDDTKYYIKSENPDRGLYTSYLTVADDGSLRWETLDEPNDRAAWNITFTASNAYYQLRNVATGRYISYRSGGFTTTTLATPTTAENLQLMRGRVSAATINGADVRGYWMVARGSSSSQTLTASTGGAVTSSGFSLANSATQQRWLIVTEDQARELSTIGVSTSLGALETSLANVRSLLGTPHTEDTEGADATLSTLLDNIDLQKASITRASEANTLTQQVIEAGLNFLGAATPLSAANPFDITFLLASPTLAQTDGWSYTVAPALSYSSVEYYQRAFDFYQVLNNLPAASYRFTAQAFQRPGSYTDAYANYLAGDTAVTASIYAGASSNSLRHIVDGASDRLLGGNEVAAGTSYIPNNMQAASLYFAAERYPNEVLTTLTGSSNSLRVGIRATSAPTSYWTIFTDFHLYAYGKLGSEVTGINDISATTDAPLFQRPQDIYSIDGRIVRRSARSLDGLQPGIYIVGGKKIMR